MSVLDRERAKRVLLGDFLAGAPVARVLDELEACITDDEEAVHA